MKISNGSFRWSDNPEDPLILKKSVITPYSFHQQCFVFVDSINLEIQQGSLVALVGMVASGKSSILAALLGEMNKAHGCVSISGSIAYVPQTAWIMNTTLQNNILFGRELNKTLYDQIIDACSLQQDLGRCKSYQ